jgi:hypothetical protein
VLLPGTPLHMLVVVGPRPLLQAFMSKGLRLVVLHMMLLLMLFFMMLWDMRLPGRARAELLVLVLVVVGSYMCLMVGPLVVLMQLLCDGPGPLAAAWALGQRALTGDGATSGASTSAGRRLAVAATARGQRIDGGADSRAAGAWEWIMLIKVGFEPTNMSRSETMHVIFVYISW